MLQNFDLEYYIRIKTDASGYAIGGVLSELTSDNLARWHLLVFFSQKMIVAKIRYDNHDRELWTIVKAFKTWRHYLEGCKHELLMLTNHNNLQQFMNTKSLSSRQVC